MSLIKSENISSRTGASPGVDLTGGSTENIFRYGLPIKSTPPFQWFPPFHFKQHSFGIFTSACDSQVIVKANWVSRPWPCFIWPCLGHSSHGPEPEKSPSMKSKCSKVKTLELRLNYPIMKLCFLQCPTIFTNFDSPS